MVNHSSVENTNSVREISDHFWDEFDSRLGQGEISTCPASGKLASGLSGGWNAGSVINAL